MRTPFLLIALIALLVAGCGEAEPDPTPTAGTDARTEVPPADESPDVPAVEVKLATPRPPMPPPPPKRTGSLMPRAGETPLQAGAVAPAFEARPEGKAILLFYRGHW